MADCCPCLVWRSHSSPALLIAQVSGSARRIVRSAEGRFLSWAGGARPIQTLFGASGGSLLLLLDVDRNLRCSLKRYRLGLSSSLDVIAMTQSREPSFLFFFLKKKKVHQTECQLKLVYTCGSQYDGSRQRRQSEGCVRAPTCLKPKTPPHAPDLVVGR
jgi:hypothetical protein